MKVNFEEYDDYYENDEYDSSGIKNINKIISSQKSISKEEKVLQNEKMRKVKIFDILTGKKKIKKENELVGILKTSSDLSLNNPQDIILDNKGRTALHYIANPDLLGNISDDQKFEITCLAEQIVKADIDPNIKDIYGKTAIDLCNDSFMKEYILANCRRYKKGAFNGK